MSKIRRSDFIAQMGKQEIDVANTKADPKLAGLQVDKADLNQDGKIAGGAEMKKLFLQVDTFDRDGSYGSMALKNADGTATKPARLLAALDKHVQPEGTISAAALHTGGLGSLSNASGGLQGVDAPKDTDTTLKMAGLDSMKEAAHTLIEERGNNYGVQQPWFNEDPNHALPANVRLGGLKGRWKCNLFAGNAMHKAGFEPPYYGNRGKGEYPNANQLFKWSDKHAGKYNNKVHFEMRGELGLKGLSSAEKKAQVAALLATAAPGDMIIVDHMGSDVADGGHCRVVTENNMSADGKGTIKCAQASSDKGRVRDEDVGRFTGEETIWILRPNKPRAGFKAAD